jgi:hypothetical protein
LPPPSSASVTSGSVTTLKSCAGDPLSVTWTSVMTKKRDSFAMLVAEPAS